ncbi:MAG: hypothetical protein JSS43_07275 [Proteobacteria bacterium]|nr:hypothetical protein [Pseudomonadota bacterium]
MRTQVADLWSLVHEGGLVIDTYCPDGTAVAFRTVLQVDGDRTLQISRCAIAPLSHYQQLRLAVRHRQAVRARSIDVLRRIERWQRVLRYGFLSGFGLSEVAWAIAHWPFDAAEWRTLLWRQGPSAVLLVLGVIGPPLMRRFLPLLLRLAASGLIKERAAALRQASRAYAVRLGLAV